MKLKLIIMLFLNIIYQNNIFAQYIYSNSNLIEFLNSSKILNFSNMYNKVNYVNKNNFKNTYIIKIVFASQIEVCADSSKDASERFISYSIIAVVNDTPYCVYPYNRMLPECNGFLYSKKIDELVNDTCLFIYSINNVDVYAYAYSTSAIIVPFNCLDRDSENNRNICRFKNIAILHIINERKIEKMLLKTILDKHIFNIDQ